MKRRTTTKAVWGRRKGKREYANTKVNTFTKLTHWQKPPTTPSRPKRGTHPNSFNT